MSKKSNLKVFFWVIGIIALISISLGVSQSVLSDQYDFTKDFSNSEFNVIAKSEIEFDKITRDEKADGVPLKVFRFTELSQQISVTDNSLSMNLKSTAWGARDWMPTGGFKTLLHTTDLNIDFNKVEKISFDWEYIGSREGATQFRYKDIIINKQLITLSSGKRDITLVEVTHKVGGEAFE